MSDASRSDVASSIDSRPISDEYRMPMCVSADAWLVNSERPASRSANASVEIVTFDDGEKRSDGLKSTYKRPPFENTLARTWTSSPAGAHSSSQCAGP